jgi:hypothetical protein
MEQTSQPNILDDRRIKLLNFLLKNHVIPEQGDFNLKDLITRIPVEEYNELFEDNKEFDAVWKNIDMPKSLASFLIENDLAKKHGDNLQLTESRGRDLQKQGSYGRLLADERHITSEARRVSELEIEANKIFRRQYKINLVIGIGTGVAALYYLLEILNGFLGFYHFAH